MHDKEINELKLLLKALPRLTDTSKNVRVKRAKKDFFYFIKTYFSHHIEDVKKESSEFRNYIHKNIDTLAKQYKVIIFTAYRGAAKTTTISKLYTLWETARKNRRFIVIISASQSLSDDILEFIRTELEDNENLKFDFNIKVQNNRIADIVLLIDNHLMKIQSFGAGVKIRGIVFLSWRPDLIILDDFENDENVLSKAYRDKLENWYKKAIRKLPSLTKHYNIIIPGTILHFDSVLARLIKMKGVYYQNFPLVREFADNYKDWTLDNPKLDIEEIHNEYKEDKASFMQERQNIPVSADDILFGGYKTYKDMPKCDMYSIALDPAMGKKNGDYFAIAVLGYKDDDKRFYALVDGYKTSPVNLIPKIIKLYVKYNSFSRTVMSVETVAYQEFFKDVLKKEASKLGIFLNVKEYRNTVNKELRLNSLAPLIKDNTILINENDDLLLEELMTYPKAPHDDLLDALEMAYRNLKSNGRVDYKIVSKVFGNRKKLRLSKYS